MNICKRPGVQDFSEEETNAMEATSNAAKQRRRPVPAKLEHRHRAQSIIQSKALDELETEVFETGLYENTDLSRGSNYGVMAAEIAYSYIWWSVFHAMPALVFFFPLCQMEVSGYEALAIVWFSPLLTLIGPIRRHLSTPTGLMITRMLSIVGVASFLAPTTISRLALLAAGNFFIILALVGSWWNMSKLDRHRHIYLHMVGYLFFLAVRVWGSSFNYIYMERSFCTVTSFLSVVIVIFLYVNDVRTPVICSKSADKTLTGPSKSSRADKRFPGLVATGVGFGALVFLTSLLFGEVSVITRFAIVPFGEGVVNPCPWGLATMLALTVGLLAFGHLSDLLSSHSWTLVGLVFSMVLYFMSSFTAFFGGLILAVYTMSLWPHLSKRVVNFSPAKILAVTILIYFLLVCLSAWVAAFNFVPGGTLTRERSDVMLILTILLIGMATRRIKQPSSGGGTRMHARNGLQVKDSNKVSVFGRVFRRLSTISEEGDEDWGEMSVGSPIHQVRAKELNLAEESEGHVFHAKVIKAGIIVFLIALVGFAHRYQPYPSMPEKEHPTMFSGGIWAFHFGYDNDAFPSMERAAQLILNSEVDVIGLLETDAARPYIGNHDITSWLEERLNVYIDYGPGPKDHTWGCLVLSKYPIVKTNHYLLPSPEGEIAPAILATVNISGNLVDFYIVHFGNDGDDLDRKLQGQKTAEIVANATNPIVMLTYITSRHGSRDYTTIVNGGNVKDIDSTDRKRFCEYIFYRGLVRLGYARISNGGLSDTEVQIGKFRIPEYPGEDFPLVTQDSGEVPPWTHFPDMFGSFFVGHYYDQTRHHFHMNTPKYFKP